jgi:hypothetical protein
VRALALAFFGSGVLVVINRTNSRQHLLLLRIVFEVVSIKMLQYLPPRFVSRCLSVAVAEGWGA